MKPRRVYLIATTCACLISLAALSWVWYTSAQSQAGSQKSPVVPKQENVPFYPDAADVEVGQVYGRELRHIFYRSEARPQDILAFYQEHLEKEGWQLFDETSGSYRWTRHYFWTDPDKVVPWDLDLNLEIRSYQEPGIKQMDPYQAGVDIGLYRAANLARVPVYPGAQQLKDEEHIYAGGKLERVTFYVTDAQPIEVEEYYKANLIDHGWWLTGEMSRDYPGFVYFNWWYGTIHNMINANLAIIAERDLEGKTKIRVEISGPIRPWP